MLAPADDAVDLPKVYRAGAPPLPEGTPLTGAAEADTVIIGAGFTGLSAALHLAEAGRKTVLLEAREIGWGGSGRNFGQVVPYTKHGESHVLSHFGPVYGPRLLEATARGPD